MRVRLAAMLGLAACVTGPGTSPHPTMEDDLLAAAATNDPVVQAQALNLLGMLGGEAGIEPIVASCSSPDASVRRAALVAAGVLVDRLPDAAPRLRPVLREALFRGDEFCRYAALQGAASAGESWQDIQGLLADTSTRVRIWAARTLVLHGMPLHPRDAAMVLRDGADTSLARAMAPVFDRLDDPSQRELLLPYLRSDEPDVRFYASEAAARLDGLAASRPRDWRPDSQVTRQTAAREDNEARRTLRQLPWHEVAERDVLAAARSSRLVLFGELHEDDGPLRRAQIKVLRAMADTAPEHLVLGYEPSVQDAQATVIDCARALGVRVLSLEPDWETLLRDERHAERDVQVASLINDCFAKYPSCRMLVLRGESHVYPDGFLCRRLPCKPLIILSLEPPSLAETDGRGPMGRTFQRDSEGQVFSWGLTDFAKGTRLFQWLAANRPESGWLAKAQ